MSESQRLLTISESAEIAGVTPETLEQYQNFGLLDAHIEDGTTRFQESDIRTLFYTKLRKEELTKEDAKSEAVEASKEATPQEETPNSAESPKEAKTSEEQDLDEDSDDEHQEPPTLEQILAEHRAAASKQGESSVTEATKAQDAISTNEMGPKDEVKSKPAELRESIEVERSSKSSNEAPSSIKQETATVKPAEPELIEITKGLREQIEMLKEERNWLRERVEKLESRSERDQMLLLSENETVRSLLEPSNQPRARFSFWKRALPFLTGPEN